MRCIISNPKGCSDPGPQFERRCILLTYRMKAGRDRKMRYLKKCFHYTPFLELLGFIPSVNDVQLAELIKIPLRSPN